ncbi:MAG: amidohydrolase family protein [Bacteroidetes bacterium]|nr:amidohydrolase family protein [Bacteroidota bacterium]
MNKSFTNAHAHIFTVNHAPDYFLKTGIGNATLAEWVDRFLQKDGTRWAMKGILKFYLLFASKDKRSVIQRYIEFVEIGTSANQTDIYKILAKNYTKFGDFKIIVLTQVLDYLDYERPSNHIHIQTQVEEVCDIKRNALFQKNIYPFLGVDARQTGFDLLEDWAKKYINIDKGFYGIKIYPAAGYFPFDKRLDLLWAWAEANQIPIMTHCTRGGSFYLGRFESLLNIGALQVQSLNENAQSMPSIRSRISNVINDPSIHKKNKVWCNIFGHPENYKPVLDKYPKLKICLAHLGGSNEVLRGAANATKDDLKLGDEYPVYLKDNWCEQVIELMKKYENVYSDISYTLSDKRALALIVDMFRQGNMVDDFGKPLINKLMYGTDFYLTQQEPKGDEPTLENIFLTSFNQDEIQKIAFDNTTAYLSSSIFT